MPSSWRLGVLLAALCLFDCGSHASHTVATYGIGSSVAHDRTVGWDIDIAPDGANLPSGRATAEDGIAVYQASCASCHGRVIPLKRWVYATSLFDYIRRAMPPQRPQSLSADDVYAATAYVLWADGRVGAHDIVDRESLPSLLPRANR